MNIKSSCLFNPFFPTVLAGMVVSYSDKFSCSSSSRMKFYFVARRAINNFSDFSTRTIFNRFRYFNFLGRGFFSIEELMYCLFTYFQGITNKSKSLTLVAKVFYNFSFSHENSVTHYYSKGIDKYPHLFVYPSLTYEWYTLLVKSLEMKSEPMLDSPMTSMFPSFYVNGVQMSEIDSWEVGEEYMLKVKVSMKNYNSYMDMKGTHSDGTIEVMSYEIEK